MSTESEIKLERYSTVEKVADGFGRVIGVRRLKPSEQTKIAGMCTDLTGFDETDEYVEQIEEATGEPVIDEATQLPVRVKTGGKLQVPHRMPLLIAASVCQIDDARIPFPKTRGELDAIYDRLDVEGLVAAGIAMAKLARTEKSGIEGLDATKNL